MTDEDRYGRRSFSLIENLCGTSNLTLEAYSVRQYGGREETTLPQAIKIVIPPGQSKVLDLNACNAACNAALEDPREAPKFKLRVFYDAGSEVEIPKRKVCLNRRISVDRCLGGEPYFHD